MSKEPSIEQIKEVAKKLFQAIGADPGALSLGPEVRDAAWELHYLLNPEEEAAMLKEEQRLALCGVNDLCIAGLDHDGDCLIPDRRAKAKHQAAHPHDHQDYCEGCQSMTDMWVEDTTRCEVCREKYPDGY